MGSGQSGQWYWGNRQIKCVHLGRRLEDTTLRSLKGLITATEQLKYIIHPLPPCGGGMSLRKRRLLIEKSNK